MTEQVEQSVSPADYAKLALGLVILIAGLVGFYYLSDYPIWARWILVLVTLGLGAFVALLSQPGKTFKEFVASSRIELRKVVWRDRDAPSTVAVTGVVFFVVAILSVFFYLLDLGLGFLTRWLTGQGA